MSDRALTKIPASFLLGGLATLLVVVLMGAVMHDPPSGLIRSAPPSLPVAVLDSGESRAVALSNTGRYQIVTWEANGGYGAFVLDTETGITKIAYSSVKGPGGKTINNLGKPFAQMP